MTRAAAPAKATKSDDVSGALGIAKAIDTPAAAAALLLTYLLAHALIRLTLMPATLGVDDAEQALFAQAWSLGYRFEQPPLYTWLLLLASAVTGAPVELPLITAVRCLTLLALHLGVYLAARSWLGRHDLAVLASLAVAGTYTLGFLAHNDLTHSTLLAVTVAWSLWLWSRLREHPSLVGFIAFGLVCGLGVLAKWNFILLAAAYLLTALLEPTTRRQAVSWNGLAAVAAGAAVAGAPALWVVFHAVSIDGLTGGVLVDPGAQRFGSTLADGFFELTKSTLVFFQPWLAVAALVAGWAAWRQFSTHGVQPLWRLVVIVWVLHAALIPLAGAVNFPERWMIPVLLPLPILIIAGLHGAQRPALRRRLLAMSLALVALGLVGRIGVAIADPQTCGKCRLRLPAEALTAALPGPAGTTVVEDMHLGGNLRVHQPGRTVLAGPPTSIWPMAGNAGCLVVWQGGDGGFARYGAAALGADLNGAQGGTVTASLIGIPEREISLSYLWLPDGSGACR